MAEKWLPGPGPLRALRDLGFKRDLLSFVEQAQRTYGETFGVRAPGMRVCVSSDPDVIERVFVTGARVVRKWDLPAFARVFGQGLLTSHGELWRRQRRLIQPAFTKERVLDYTPAVRARARAMVASWGEGGARDVHRDVSRLALGVSAESLFGVDVSQVEELVHEANDRLSRCFDDSMSSIPIPLGVPTPKNRRALKALQELDRALLGLIARRRSEPPRADFLGALLAARDEQQGPMSDQQLRDECMTMILASHETTAAAVSWTLLLLARHPEIATAVQRELDHVVGERSLEASDLSELALLRQVLHESLRLYPPVWGIGRVNTEPLDVGFATLPAGTTIMLLPYLTHRAPRLFAEPTRFWPERWASAAMSELPKTAFLPFGAGPRKCVGAQFAMIESSIMVAEIMRCFSLREDITQPVRLQPSVTLRPAAGLHLVLTRRGAR